MVKKHKTIYPKKFVSFCAFLFLLLCQIPAHPLLVLASPYILDEQFIDNHNHWPLISEKNFTAKIKNNAYSLHNNSNGDDPRFVTLGSLVTNDGSDFVIEVTAKNTAKGANQNWFGLAWGMRDAGNYHAMLINNDGYLRIVSTADNTVKAKVKGFHTDSIKSGQPNTLTIIRKDGVEHFIVNGYEISFGNDFSVHGSHAGFYLSPGTMVEATRFRVTAGVAPEHLSQIGNYFPTKPIGSVVSDQAKIIINAITLNPSTVKSSSPYDLTIDYIISDPANDPRFANLTVPLNLTYEVLENDKVLFMRKVTLEVLINKKNNATKRGLVAGKNKGRYTMRVTLECFGRFSGKSIPLVVE